MKLKRRKPIEASPSPSELVEVTSMSSAGREFLTANRYKRSMSVSISHSIPPTESASVEASESLPPEEEGVEWAYAKKTVYSTNTKPVYVSNAKRAKCHYCGLWGDRQTTCAHCGASID